MLVLDKQKPLNMLFKSVKNEKPPRKLECAVIRDGMLFTAKSYEHWWTVKHIKYYAPVQTDTMRDTDLWAPLQEVMRRLVLQKES